MRTTTRAQKRKREVAADHVCGIPEHLWVTIASKIDPYDDAAFSMTNKLFRRVLAEAKGTTTVAVHVEKARLLEDPPAFTPSWFRWAYSSPNLRPGGPAGCRDSEEDGNNIIIYQWDLLRLASFLGSVESLEWLMKQRIGIYGETRTCEYAALGGSLDALKWLRKKHFAWDKRTCKAAAESGNLGVLQWARANGCHWTVATCSEAAAEGHLEVLKWARSQNPPCPWDEYTASSAAGEGHFETLKWALSQTPPCPWSEYTLASCAAGGHLEIMEWLLQRGCPWDGQVYAMAAEYGEVKSMDFAWRHGLPLDEWALVGAVRANNLEVLLWLQNRGCPWGSAASRREILIFRGES